MASHDHPQRNASSVQDGHREAGGRRLCRGPSSSFDTALKSPGKESDGFQLGRAVYRADAEFLLKDYNAAIHTYDLLLEMKPDTP
ncbi:MAG: hypothetical protein ACLTBV_18145 [Enterocloster bolteae]